MSDEPQFGAEPLKEFLSEGEEIIEKLGRDLIALDRRSRGHHRDPEKGAGAGPSAGSPGWPDVEASGGAADIDPELLNDIFRGAHSLKGLSGMFGFKGLTALSHNLENLLDALRLGKVPLDDSILDLLFAGLDLLSRQMKALGSNREAEGGVEDAEIDAFVARLNAVAARVGGKTTTTAAGFDPAILGVLTEFEEHRLDENLRAGRTLYRVRATFDLATFDQGLAELTARLKPIGEVITTLPGAADAAPGQIQFDIVLGSEGPLEQVQATVAGLGAAVSPLAESPASAAAGQAMGGGPPAAVPAEAAGGQASSETVRQALHGEPRGEPAPEGQPPAGQAPDVLAAADAPADAAPARGARAVEPGPEPGSLKSVAQTVRVDIGRLDALMTIVGELVLDKTVIGGIAEELRRVPGVVELSGALTKASRSLEKKLAELQERVMEVRMVPLSQAFDKMARTVRKLSRDAGKEIDLVISGADTELDKLIVEELVDPLMHIIRNAVDHGIEPSDERLRAGKPPRGRIDLRAYQKGNHVVVEVADDGRGLDFDRVREVAVAQGLIPPDAPPLKAREAFDLLCSPGFSTREAVTEISGRGVGMDVVRTVIAQLSGGLDFETTPGRGTTIVITLPMTLAIIQALVVSTCGRTYAIPLNQVQENLMVAPGDIRTVERREVIQLRERTLPLARLERLFRLTPPAGWRPGSSRGDGRLYVVVVGMGDRSLGIVVDDLLGQQDVVIKSVGELLKGVKGIAGAADLGNQQTILVLDVGGLIDEAIRLGADRQVALTAKERSGC